MNTDKIYAICHCASAPGPVQKSPVFQTSMFENGGFYFHFEDYHSSGTAYRFAMIS